MKEKMYVGGIEEVERNEVKATRGLNGRAKSSRCEGEIMYER